MNSKEYFDTIRGVSLFDEINGQDLEAILECLKCEIKTVRKNEVILLAGEKPLYMGVVLAGMLHIIREDYDGNRTLVASATSGDIFGEALCCAGVDESPVTVLAVDETTVMLLEYARIVRVCQSACGYHQKLIENMLHLVASKNIFLQNRLEIMSIKSVRAKVLRYLETLASKQGRNIVLPFNQTKLADYLCVERSALAHELARMKKDGLIDYKRNAFTLTV